VEAPLRRARQAPRPRPATTSSTRARPTSTPAGARGPQDPPRAAGRGGAQGHRRAREADRRRAQAEGRRAAEHILADSWGWHPGVHDGIDLICPPNEPLYAICKATVVRADAAGWWGKGAPADPVLKAKGDGIIVIRSLVDAGPIRKGMNLCYGHAEGAVVKAGQTVEAGDHIGHAGFANAWHTHFMVNMRKDALGLGDRDPKPVVDYPSAAPSDKVTAAGAAGAVGARRVRRWPARVRGRPGGRGGDRDVVRVRRGLPEAGEPVGLSPAGGT
jgi:murein DD-endopeptidase MepM/ murein hydrolase activator NlpD